MVIMCAMRWSVYALLDPRTEEPRYIGSTSASLRRRLSEHCRRTRRDNPKRPLNAWIIDLKVRPKIVQLSSSTTKEDAEDDERAYILSTPNLLNVANGRVAPCSALPVFTPDPAAHVHDRARVVAALVDEGAVDGGPWAHVETTRMRAGLTLRPFNEAALRLAEYGAIELRRGDCRFPIVAGDGTTYSYARVR
jgi:hypothetical protein